jgi:hypothetical protein
MTRAGRAAVVALMAVAVVGGLLVYRSATAPTDRERIAAAVRAFQEAGNRMTPDEVRHSFGEPDTVFRNNPRALCWSYANPYEIRIAGDRSVRQPGSQPTSSLTARPDKREPLNRLACASVRECPPTERALAGVSAFRAAERPSKLLLVDQARFCRARRGRELALSGE